MGVLFEKRGEDYYYSCQDNKEYEELNVRDKACDIIVTHSRIAILLFDCVVYLSENGSEKERETLNSRKILPKKVCRQQLLRKLKNNVQDYMRNKKCPYDNFWQQINYYNSWCQNGKNWNLICEKLRLNSLNTILKMLKQTLEFTNNNELYKDLSEMNRLRNRVAHGDLAVRWCNKDWLDKKIFDALDIEIENNPFTDIEQLYKEYMDLAEKWKPIFDVGPDAIIEELRRKNNEQ